jgi:chromosome segregation ATPase
MTDPITPPPESNNEDTDVEFLDPSNFKSTWGLPLMISILGMAAGYMLHMVTAQPEIITDTVIIKQELTQDQLALLCTDEVADERDALRDAQAIVADLESQLGNYEEEVQKLKSAAKKGKAGAVAAQKKWRAMESEIVELKTRLAQAEEERDVALEELQETVVALNQQIKETRKAKNEVRRYKDLNTKHSWESFVANAKIAICGELWVSGRGRQRRCNEAVQEALTPEIKTRFATCVDSYQSTPLFLRKETDDLPSFTVSLPKNRFTKNKWYIQFCDPTLPEGTRQKLKAIEAEKSNDDKVKKKVDGPSWDDLDDLLDDDELDNLPD